MGLLNIVLELLAVGLVTDSLLLLLGGLESVLELLLGEVEVVLEVLDVVVHAKSRLALLLGVRLSVTGWEGSGFLLTVDISKGGLDGAIGSWGLRRLRESWIAEAWPWAVLWSLVVGVELLAKLLLGVLEIGLSPEDVSIHAEVWDEIVDWIGVVTD